MTAFLLAMAYRSWQLHRHDEVQDDVEDRRIARLAARDERAFEDDDTEDTTTSLDEEAAETRDETDEGGPVPEPATTAASTTTEDGEGR
jgi:multicomponent Na+:H+ antiporter subunit C